MPSPIEAFALTRARRLSALVLTAWLSVASSAATATCETRDPTVIASVFPSPVAALAAMHHRYAEHGRQNDLELAGTIYRVGDEYLISVASGCAGSDQIQFRVRPLVNAQIAALWHSHGAAGTHRAMFSETDIKLVRATGVPLYLITPNGLLKVLQPRQANKTRRSFYSRRSLVRRQRGAVGSTVAGWIAATQR